MVTHRNCYLFFSLTTMRSNSSNNFRRKRVTPLQHRSVEVDVESLLLLDNCCKGCSKGERCCCSSYEVCITTAELKRIIRFLPEAAKFCPHLITIGGYENVFEKEEHGLFSIDTTDDGLCLFAYWSNQRIHCSLHTVAITLGLPLAQVKPKVCILWPMHFSEGNEVLSIINDAYLFSCNVRKGRDSRNLCPDFVEAIEQVYGVGCGTQVKYASENGDRRTLLVIRQ